jgi:hypothetical protein
MSAGDTNTLKLVSLAALLGLDASVLLTSDDDVTHAVWRKVIEQSQEWWPVQANSMAQRIADRVIATLAEALK